MDSTLQRIIHELNTRRIFLEEELHKVSLALNALTGKSVALTRELPSQERKIGGRFIDQIISILKEEEKSLTSRELYRRFKLRNEKDFEMKNFSSRLSMEKKKGKIKMDLIEKEFYWGLPDWFDSNNKLLHKYTAENSATNAND